MPGKTTAMNPAPDHGETSYRGSGRLDGKKAVTGVGSETEGGDNAAWLGLRSL